MNNQFSFINWISIQAWRKACITKSIIFLHLDRIVIETCTWNRDSHGLYDYESSDIKKAHYKTHQECFLIRNPVGEVKIISEKEYPNGAQQNSSLLMRFQAKDLSKSFYKNE